MEVKGFNENEISEKSKEALQSETWQEARKAMKREVKHYRVGDNEDYEYEWSKAVLNYLESGYASEDGKNEVEVGNTTYKILKRENVTAFYDEAGNTLFDVENARIKEEYEAMKMTETGNEPQSEIGKAISSIEKQAFEHAIENDTDKKNDNEDITSKECDGPVEETQIKEEAKVEENAQKSSVYIGVVGAVTKLQEELKKAKEKDFAKPVIEHLIERCKDSESLSSDVCQDHKTWEKCYKYIYDQARKQIKGSSGAVRDDVVYEWAEDYYHKDDKAEEEKKAKETAEKKKKQEEKKAKEAESKTKGPKPAVTQENKTEVSKPKTEPKPKKSSKDMDGQLDMFSLLGM